MKELFRKLSNLFKFPKEDRLVNANTDTPDMSGPDDSNIDALETSEPKTDKSGPELEGEGTLEEKTTSEAEFKLAKAKKRVKEDVKKLKKGEEKLTGKWEEEAGKEGAKRLLAEREANEKILDRITEYSRIERVEPPESEEVGPELPPLVPIREEFELSTKEGYEKSVEDMFFGRQKGQDTAGTNWEDTIKFFKVLKESGDMDALVKRAEELHDSGNIEDIKGFEFWVDKNVRDATKEGKYNEEEKGEIRKKMKELVADFVPRPIEEETPVQLAEAEEKPFQITDEELDKFAAGEVEDKEWGGPEPHVMSPAEKVDQLRKEKPPVEWAKPKSPKSSDLPE